MKELKDGVYWVGGTDWIVRHFHGYELSTHRGSTYNAYLIKDEKTVLIDTVWAPLTDMFLEHLKEVVDPSTIDYIVVNHAEPDHSGALPAILEYCPNATVIVSKAGLETTKKHYHKDWNFKVVGTGDKLNIGENDLVFVEAKMLHWPDSMFTYLTGKNILFSNDAFGQHFASSDIFNDTVDETEVNQEALKYYEWAKGNSEKSVVILYNSMWGATHKMADFIVHGIGEAGLSYKIYNAATADRNDVIAEIFKAKGILLGSSTVNNGVLTSLTPFMEDLTGLKFINNIYYFT